MAHKYTLKPGHEKKKKKKKKRGKTILYIRKSPPRDIKKGEGQGPNERQEFMRVPNSGSKERGRHTASCAKEFSSDENKVPEKSLAGKGAMPSVKGPF